MVGGGVPIAIAPTNATAPRILARFLVMVHLLLVGGFPVRAAACSRIPWTQRGSPSTGSAMPGNPAEDELNRCDGTISHPCAQTCLHPDTPPPRLTPAHPPTS